VEDNELIALFDRKFAEQDQRMDGRFAQMEARFAQIDGRFAQIDGRFAQMDGHFAQMDGHFAQMDGRFAQMDGRFAQMDTQFDDLRIEVGARLEHMHDDIKKIAEGVDTVNEKVDRFHNETMTELIDVRSDIRISFTMLGKRVTGLENTRS
jgi:hypothetical protein